MKNLLKLLAKQTPADEPVEVRPGMNTLGCGQIHLRVQVFRAAENKWFDVDEVKS